MRKEDSSASGGGIFLRLSLLDPVMSSLGLLADVFVTPLASEKLKQVNETEIIDWYSTFSFWTSRFLHMLLIFLFKLDLPEIAATFAPRLSLYDITVTSILTAEKHNELLGRQIVQYSSYSPVLNYSYSDYDETGTTPESCYVTLVRGYPNSNSNCMIYAQNLK